MNSPSSDVKEIVKKEVFTNETIFNSLQPDQPDKVISVFAIPGGADPSPTVVYEMPVIKVMSRGAPGGYEEADARLRKIANYLHKLTEYITAGSRIIQILQIGNIAFDGYDEASRPQLSVNFSMHRTDLI